MKNGFFAPHFHSVIVFQLLALFALTPGHPLAHASETEAAKFRYIKGVVWVETGDEKQKAQAQQVLEPDSMISVEDESFAIVELIDGSSFKVESNSQVIVHDLAAKAEENLAAAAAGANGEGPSTATELTLLFGSLFVEVVKTLAPTGGDISSSSGGPGDHSKFTVKTKRGLSIGVRGTEFFASVDEETGDVVTSVNEGQVIVADPQRDDMEEVSPGQSLVVEKGETLSRPQNFEWGQKLPWGRQRWGNPEFRDQHLERRQQRRDFFQKVRQEFAPKRRELQEQRQRRPLGQMKQFFHKRRENVQNFRQNVRNHRRDKFRQGMERRLGPGNGPGNGHMNGPGNGPGQFHKGPLGMPGQPQGNPPPPPAPAPKR